MRGLMAAGMQDTSAGGGAVQQVDVTACLLQPLRGS